MRVGLRVRAGGQGRAALSAQREGHQVQVGHSLQEEPLPDRHRVRFGGHRTIHTKMKYIIN